MQQVMPELLAHRHGQLFKRAVSVAELIKEGHNKVEPPVLEGGMEVVYQPKAKPSAEERAE